LAVELGRTPWIRMADPFCPRLRRVLVEALERYEREVTRLPYHALGKTIDGGLYACTPLSVWETAAEVRLLREQGVTVVGQSSGQEAAAARVTSICLAVANPVANYAEGLQGGVWIDGGMDRFYHDCSMPMGVVMYWALEAAVEQRRECGCTQINARGDVSSLTKER
jgi:hypothetical protein